eukprot:TRINITY_DN8312_c0_g1_i4.p1 TRINITY_DN8312_c0_g1~~TRINITY_DN8312_c0_g1_i4.p1  ORF type:complete len:115 (-),score=4.33 TRINITY_DN8312_c0_g1_i4:70-414(-)
MTIMDCLFFKIGYQYGVIVQRSVNNVMELQLLFKNYYMGFRVWQFGNGIGNQLKWNFVQIVLRGKDISQVCLLTNIVGRFLYQVGQLESSLMIKSLRHINSFVQINLKLRIHLF